MFALYIISLLASSHAANTINFGSWVVPYGVASVTSPSSVQLTFVPPGGTQIAAPAQREGTFCANVAPPNTPGIALTMSLFGSGQHQKSIEIVWYQSLIAQNEVMVNLWDNLNVNNIINNTIKVPNSINAHYCISWKDGGDAIWYIDGIQVQKQSIADFSIPLAPTIVIWGALTVPWFITIGGTYNPIPGVNPKVGLTNAYLSPVQEIGVVTFEPSAVATYVPSATPSAPSPSPSFKPTLVPSIQPTAAYVASTTTSPTTGLALAADGSTNSNSGLVAGVVVGVLVALALIMAAGYYYYITNNGKEVFKGECSVDSKAIYPSPRNGIVQGDSPIGGSSSDSSPARRRSSARKMSIGISKEADGQSMA